MALEDVLQQFRNRLGRDYISSGVIGLDGVHLAFDSVDICHDEVKAAAELADGLKHIMDMVNDTESGSVNYIIIATDACKIFLNPIGDSKKYFNSLTIKAGGNMGKAILELEKIEKMLAQEIA
ncbi:MAG: hypothetical protein HZA78_07420 [Candidatus Schekmanbacteria bacterium]|nr:hypothetical protein [Candidatus Schekmanbacteria bacterium]